MTSVTFEVPGSVKGQARTGGKGTLRFKTPETRLYENRIAMAARDAMAGRELFLGPVSLKLIAVFQTPSSASKKRQAAMLRGEIMPTVKPDWDNIAKTTDAMKGIVWKDDVQVVRGAVVKVYGSTPGLTITVNEILP